MEYNADLAISAEECQRCISRASAFGIYNGRNSMLQSLEVFQYVRKQLSTQIMYELHKIGSTFSILYSDSTDEQTFASRCFVADLRPKARQPSKH